MNALFQNDLNLDIIIGPVTAGADAMAYSMFEPWSHVSGPLSKHRLWCLFNFNGCLDQLCRVFKLGRAGPIGCHYYPAKRRYYSDPFPMFLVRRVQKAFT